MTMKQKKLFENKSLRLKEYDYSYPGAYFVTICVDDRKCVFGDVVDGKMVLNALGKIADECLIDIPAHFNNTEIPIHVVMPNHAHAVVNIFDEISVGQTHAFDSQRRAFDLQNDRKHQKLPIIIGSYKSAVTKEINKMFPSVNFKWQTSYHDHILGTEIALKNIYNYIIFNPHNWQVDLENKEYLRTLTMKEREKKAEEFYRGLIRIP
jgi:putative transposase